MASRKLYEAIAKALRESNLTDDQRFEVAHAIGAEFQKNNPRFDLVRFVEACKP